MALTVADKLIQSIMTLLAVAAVGGLLVWHFYVEPKRAGVFDEPSLAVERPGSSAEPPAPLPEPEPPPRFVAVEPPVAEPPPELPALDASDDAVSSALAERLSRSLIDTVLITDDLLRNIVVTVDNLPRDRVSMKVRAVRAAPGPFVVRGDPDDLAIDPSNSARYDAYVQLATSTNPAQVADLYVQYYPLLQEAYEELGYPGRQFHGRLGEVLAHLLETPSVDEPIALVRPHVLYQFKAPELENLSAGQKALLRLGTANAATVADWLGAFRAEIDRRVLP